MKRLAAALLVLALLAGAAAWLVPQWLQRAWSPEAWRTKLEDALGMPVQWRGWTFGAFPHPHAQILGLHGEKDQGMRWRAKRVVIDLPWWALLFGQMDRLRLRIEGLQWELAREMPRLDAWAVALASASWPQPKAWRLDRMEIVDAVIRFSDGAWRIETAQIDGDPMRGKASIALSGCERKLPEAEGSCTQSELRWQAQGTIGPIEQRAHPPLALSWSLQGQATITPWQATGQWRRQENGQWTLAAEVRLQALPQMKAVFFAEGTAAGRWALRRLAWLQGDEELAVLEGAGSLVNEEFRGRLRTVPISPAAIEAWARAWGLSVRLPQAPSVQASFEVSPQAIVVHGARLQMGQQRLQLQASARRTFQAWEGRLSLDADRITVANWLPAVAAIGALLPDLQKMRDVRAPAEFRWRLRARIGSLEWQGHRWERLQAMLWLDRSGGRCDALRAQWAGGALELSGDWEGWPPQRWQAKVALQGVHLVRLWRELGLVAWLSGRADLEGVLLQQGPEEPIRGKGRFVAHGGRLRAPSAEWAWLDGLPYRELAGRWQLDAEALRVVPLRLVARALRAEGGVRIARDSRHALDGTIRITTRRRMRVLGVSVPAGARFELGLSGQLDAPIVTLAGGAL